MSQSNKKILVSGCGISYSKQQEKSWVKILHTMGVKIKDVGGPAVSNQWILNKVICELSSNTNYTHAIIQLSAIGKLDVEVFDNRESELVKADSLRNFTVQGIWPSSFSTEHQAKKLYNQFLVSPKLEVEDLFCKLILLADFCKRRQIELIVYEGYDVQWDKYSDQLIDIVENLNDPWYTQYQKSDSYAHHNYQNYNTVPCLDFQIELASLVSKRVGIDLSTKLEWLKQKLQSST